MTTLKQVAVAWLAANDPGPLKVDPSHHGTRRRYGLGCRCDECREAHLRYYRDLYQTRKLKGERR